MKKKNLIWLFFFIKLESFGVIGQGAVQRVFLDFTVGKEVDLNSNLFSLV